MLGWTIPNLGLLAHPVPRYRLISREAFTITISGQITNIQNLLISGTRKGIDMNLVHKLNLIKNMTIQKNLQRIYDIKEDLRPK